MRVKKWLDKVAYKSTMDLGGEISDVYKSKFDDSYITHVGLEENMEFLAERGITKELTHGVGYSPLIKKWYGWSHRAIFGFKIGSTCKKGDCHYKGPNLKEQEEDAIRFWDDVGHVNTICEGIVEEDGEKYFDIKWDYDNTVHNKTLRGTIGGCLHHIKSVGKGEWTAKTMEDAKQMAIDFSEGVS